MCGVVFAVALVPMKLGQFAHSVVDLGGLILRASITSRITPK